ncbi:multidrug ABC transporter ATP-binding protein [Aerococcus urinaehominis]|uniref:Multidrug ABC transporter ATP-binding protein n=1 Tax=Aerococcus urinaehominis TaxID=128944 RepID=A0A120IAW9_9LACT|nr:ABC-F family ATP-binding cassette domain-containing protein [Aerococcus urinaehominis]AMB99398.1 multidrug ABC transporter ATP-binding protein [Aerococcus urinaehominis]SDM23832.1 ATP-binding cassette, subfamily F, member 3 [Aerococcus urinaehominis]
MIILQGSQLARRFAGLALFEDVNITIQDKSRIALVGRNGSGKSTLLKMLTGLEEPDAGSISKAKGLTIGYLDQHSAVDSDRTIYGEMLAVFDPVLKLLDQAEQSANLLADPEIMADPDRYQEALAQYDRLQEDLNRHNAYGYESEIKMVLAGFQFDQADYDKPVAHLSGGQRTRLALAKLLLEKKDLLILDEPTNHLDIDTLTWLEAYLPKYPGALLIVSHDRYFLDSVTNETYEMTQGKSYHYAGNYSFYLQEKSQRLALAQKAYDKQQAEIARLEDYVQRNLVRASTTKMAQSRRKQLEKMTRLSKPQADDRSARIQFVADKESGNIVVIAEDLAIGYDQEILAQNINLDLRKQEAIAVVGPNGVGKSTLLKTLIKEIPALAGHIEYGTGVSLGYYDQELGNRHSKKDVLHELWDAHPQMREQDIRTILGSFLFTGDDVNKSVTNLSGGEKARLELAKLALDHDNFLVLDEPTNHLDIDSKEVLENALIEYNGSLIFVSHDRYFINRIATQVLEISPEGSTLYLGDYDYYSQKKAEIQERDRLKAAQDQQTAAEKPTSSQGQIDYQAQKKNQKEIRRLKREVDQLETDINQLDQEIAAIELAMTNPDIFNDSYELNKLNTSLQEKKELQEEKMLIWEARALDLATYEE